MMSHIVKMQSIHCMVLMPSRPPLVFTMQQCSHSAQDLEASKDHCRSGIDFSDFHVPEGSQAMAYNRGQQPVDHDLPDDHRQVTGRSYP